MPFVPHCNIPGSFALARTVNGSSNPFYVMLTNARIFNLPSSRQQDFNSPLKSHPFVMTSHVLQIRSTSLSRHRMPSDFLSKSTPERHLDIAGQPGGLPHLPHRSPKLFLNRRLDEPRAKPPMFGRTGD